jgi:peptidoglycan/LPS O-acetylase OafA/YrhL
MSENLTALRTDQDRRGSTLGQKPGRIPSLDGFRAFAICLVIAAHCQTATGFPHSLQWTGYFADGDFGVRVFFVISGFLITTLLLQEEHSHGSISLPLFYYRRALRILPVYWAYVLAAAVYAAICGLNIPFRNYLQTLTFTTGWHSANPWILGHSWSLCVEEAFYLGWPFLLIRLSQKGRIAAAIGCLLLGPLVRVVNYKYGWPDSHHLVWLNIDLIMWGCLLALLHDRLRATLTYLFSRNAVLYHILAVVAIVGVRWVFRHKMLALITVPFYWTIDCAAICYILYFHTFISKGVVFKFLNSAPIVAIGVLSYSLYLWQELFLIPQEESKFFWQSFPLNVLGAFVIAAVSYYLWEKPILKLRKKLHGAALSHLN